MNGNTLTPSRMHFADLLRTAGVGLRTRKLRTGLSALGIMIGIASLVAVLGLSDSSKSDNKHTGSFQLFQLFSAQQQFSSRQPVIHSKFKLVIHDPHDWQRYIFTGI